MKIGPQEVTTKSCFSGLEIVKKSKGNIFTEKPVFCDNGNSIVISSGRSLHLYNTSTGNHVKELFQCSDDIISCQLHPYKQSQVIAVTENGEVTVYNLKTNEIQYSIKLSLNGKLLNKQKSPKFEGEKPVENFDWETQPLDSLQHRRFFHAEVKPFQNNASEIFIWATWSLNEELQSHLSAFTLSNGKHIRLFHLQTTGLQKRSFNFIIKTVQNLEIFIGMSNHYIQITTYDLKKTPSSIKHYIGNEKTVSCLAFHPVECCFASGDSLGRIIIWQNIFEKHPLKEILHWHTLPVRDLYFSKFGNYLFSGGEENVLVKWSLNTHNKDFLPRLSSAINHISGNSESSLLSISTMDNKILIMDYAFQSISTIQHFSRWSLIKGDNKLNIFTIDPRSNCFVLNGKTGHIQFLSLNEDGKFVYTFDVTNRNFITSDADKTIENTEVTHAKFNKDGKWLVTVESRKSELCWESRLKFWLFSEKQNSFTLSTNIELPHEGSQVHSLEISASDLVVTTGGDKKFRLWAIFEDDRGPKTKQFWAVHSIKRYRNFSCYGTDFSKDASLVAVTFGPVLTIWETESCELKCTLSVPYRKDQLKFCKFGNYEFSHLLVTGTEFMISSWNVITLSIIWSVPLKLSILISDPFSIYMAAFSTDNSLIIFNPSLPTPDLILKKLTNSPVTAAHFVQNRTNELCLYFLTLNQELFSLENSEKLTLNTSNDGVHTFSTPYSFHLAKIQNSIVSDKKETFLLNKNKKQFVTSLLDSPAHTLPNPSLICMEAIKGLIFFSDNQSKVIPSIKVNENDDVKVNEISSNHNIVELDKLENKLLKIVDKIFV